VPVQLELRKCAAPVPGFTGSVAIRRASGSRARRGDGPGPSS
jgi:hypothetical protein